MKRTTAFVLCLLLAAAMVPGLPQTAAAETVYYVENEWNFVDQSMDVSGGIPEFAEGVLGRIRRSGVLKAAVNPHLAPYAFTDPDKADTDQYVGADMELARLIAKRMGVELQVIPLEGSQVLPALTEDHCDLTLSAVSYTPGRAIAYTLSKGYYYPEDPGETGILIRAEDREAISSVDALEGRIIAAQSNSLQETIGAGAVRNYLEFRRLSSVQMVYEAVRTGKADAAVVDLKSAGEYLKLNPDTGLCLAEGMTFIPERQYQGYRAAAKKGEEQLICFVNGVIDEVLANGIYETWVTEALERAKQLEP